MGMEAIEDWWWWGAASSAQTTAAVVSLRRGIRDSGASMPFKAFAVATLFVSGGATAAIAVLHANGFRNLDDWKRFGEEIRRALRAPSRSSGGSDGDGRRRKRGEEEMI